MNTEQDVKKGFILYYDYENHLSLLTDEERGQLFSALLRYGASGERPSLTGAAAMAFSFISMQMDRDAAKYEKVRKSKSEAGKKGGRPSTQKQTKAKKADTDIDTDTDTDIVTVTGTDTVTDAGTAYPPCSGQGPENGRESARAAGGEGSDGTQGPMAEGFDEFWNAYPKKDGRAACLSFWKKLKPDRALREKMLDTLRWQKETEQWRVEEGRFIPSPLRWLRQGCWDNEPVRVRAWDPPKERRGEPRKESYSTFDPEEFFRLAVEKSNAEARLLTDDDIPPRKPFPE